MIVLVVGTCAEPAAAQGHFVQTKFDFPRQPGFMS